MNIQYIIKAFKKYSPSQGIIPLGRWKIHNYSQTILKSKYANEDNCFTYKKQESEEIDELYVYMMGNESLPDIKK